MTLSSVQAERTLQDYGGVPIDRVAARVVRRGEVYIPDKRITQLMFEAPPLPVSRARNRASGEKSPQNLKGIRWGRLEVISYYGRRPTAKEGGADNQLWLCRCACGLYLVRVALTIKKRKDPDDKCDICRHLAFLKRNEQYRRYGKNLDEVAARTETATACPTNGNEGAEC